MSLLGSLTLPKTAIEKGVQWALIMLITLRHDRISSSPNKQTTVESLASRVEQGQAQNKRSVTRYRHAQAVKEQADMHEAMGKCNLRLDTNVAFPLKIPDSNPPSARGPVGQGITSSWVN